MQKLAADKIIQKQMENPTKRVNKGEVLRDVGYSESVSKRPTTVTESAGFLTYMSDSGITERNLAGMLAEDLQAKVGERLGEMKLAAQLMGIDGAADNSTNVQVNVMFDKMRAMIDGEVINDEE